MVLVDSSVWISYLKDSDQRSVGPLNSLIVENNRACICGIVLQEVLQGVREEKEYRLLKERFSLLPYYEAEKSTYLLASEIYRTLRKKGKTVVGADALIAAITIENKLQLFTLDVHFGMIADSYKNLLLFKNKI